LLEQAYRSRHGDVERFGVSGHRDFNRPVRNPAHFGTDARPFIAEDFAAFDLILVADRGHYRHLSALAPDDAAHAKIGFMLDTLPENPGAELPDPYYGEAADFERTFTLLEAALHARFA